MEAAPSSTEAAEVLTLIGDLYAAEAAAQETAAGDPARLLTERRARAAPVVEAIRRWVTAQRALPQSTLGKALAYTTEPAGRTRTPSSTCAGMPRVPRRCSRRWRRS